MVSLPEIKASNAQIDEDNLPRLAVFVGGTAGIGKAALTALFSQKAPLKIYILGRNEASHREFLQHLQQSNSEAEIVWLEGQVTLLAEVKRFCIEIKSREESIDLLFLSAGFLPFAERQETSEGLETSLALLYWTRILFIVHLVPLLNATSSTRPTYKPRIISILGAGFEDAIIPLNDLDLRNPRNFSLQKVVKQGATLNALTLAHLAADPANLGVVFIHNHPGEVKTEIFKNGWGGGKTLDPKLMSPGVKTGMDPEVSGERSLYLITSLQFGGKGVSLPYGQGGGLTIAKTGRGALFCVNERVECIQQESVLGQLKLRSADEIVWEKTQEVLKLYY